jgi:hypothetical protein
MCSSEATCSRYRTCKPSDARHNPADYRGSFIKSDRRSGSRGPDGRKGACRRNCGRTKNAEHVCPVKLSIGLDSSSYFVFGGRGNNRHHIHPKLMMKVVALTSRELSGAEKTALGKYRKAGLSCSGAAQIMRTSSNIYLAPQAVRHYTQAIQYAEFSNETSVPKVYGTTTDRLFITLKSKRHGHIVLSHKGMTHPNPSVDIPNCVESPLATTQAFLSSLPSNERVLMDAFVANHQQSREIPESQDMFLAIVWMTASERSIFRKFPFVIKLDITSKTNSRRFPLLTVTGKNSDNAIFTVMRCWVPNEQSWIVGWLRLYALPSLLGKDMSRITLIVSDGDSQEIAQINNLIDVLLKKAHQIRCG